MHKVKRIEYPVRYVVHDSLARFTDATGRPIFTIRSFDYKGTVYMAASVCKALNDHFLLVNAIGDTIEMVDTVITSLGLTPEQAQRLEEIKSLKAVSRVGGGRAPKD